MGVPASTQPNHIPKTPAHQEPSAEPDRESEATLARATDLSVGTLVVREIQGRHEWNARVLGLPHYDLRQGYEWGEVRESQGWAPRRLAVFDNGTCVAAVSILIRRLPIPRWSILYAPGGPLLLDVKYEPAWQALMEGIRRLAAETRAVFLRVDPKVRNEDAALRDALLARGFRLLGEDWTTWNTPRIGMTMDVKEPEEEIKRTLRKRYREYIASAPKRGLAVRRAVSSKDARDFHLSLAIMGRQKRLPVRGRRHFKRLWAEYVRPGRGVLLLAEHKGEVVGGLLGARLGRKAEMLYVNIREQVGGMRLHQGPLLYWEFIRWAKEFGCEMIDWGGTGTHFLPKEDDPGFGIYHFKLGFNSRLEYRTGYYDLVFLPRLYESFRTLETSAAARAWTVRSKFNARFSRLREALQTGVRKARQFQVSLRQRGVAKTFYWAGFGYFKSNRLAIFARDLSGAPIDVTPRADVTFEVWNADDLRAWRGNRPDLPPEFFQDEIDGVETCVVALFRGEVVGLIWIYSFDDASRLFNLRVLEADLNNGCVLPQYRGRGLFRDILVHSCLWLRDHDYRTAYACVHTGNLPSLRAFRNVGFGEIGSVRHFLVYRPKFYRGEL